jgi:hypothetical protein
MDQQIVMPKRSEALTVSGSYKPICFFLTPREIVDLSTIENGVFVQFESPSNLLPSFKGLSVSIIYGISLVIQSNLKVKQFEFPFLITSTGNSQNPQEVR